LKTLTGAQVIMEILKEEGVETIFGFPGGAVIDLYDELAKTDIKHILVRHEQGAVHAADGYARAKGSVGVCLVTSGPGRRIPSVGSRLLIWIRFPWWFSQGKSLRD